jgi:hypothetical protein
MHGFFRGQAKKKKTFFERGERISKKVMMLTLIIEAKV